MLRGTMLYLAEQPTMKRVFGGPLAKPLVRRFVAGETLAEALSAVQAINDAGMTVSLDNLGESVANAEAANAAAAEACFAVASISLRDIARLAAAISSRL